MWLQELLIKNTEQKEGEFEIPLSFLTLDSFFVHNVDSFLEEMSANDARPLEVPAGCTLKVQVLDIFLNLPYRDVLAKC